MSKKTDKAFQNLIQAQQKYAALRKEAIERAKKSISMHQTSESAPIAPRKKALARQPFKNASRSITPSPIPPRDHAPSTTEEYKKMVMQQFLKELHFLKGISLEKRILTTHPGIEISEKDMQHINYVQAIIDILYADNQKSPDEKGEIIGGLVMNLEQQFKANKNSPLKKLVRNWHKIFATSNYMSMKSQMQLFAFMNSSGLSKTDPESFKLFCKQIESICVSHKIPTSLMHQLHRIEQVPISDAINAHEASFLKFNERLWPYLDPQSPATKLQANIRKHYEQKGGSHSKRNLIRNDQMDLLQSFIDTICLDNNYTDIEKELLLKAVLENFQIQKRPR